MAVFDDRDQRIVVRIVYDGPGFAGKTTNLRKLCTFFTTRRRSELFTPEERDGRTQHFDWLQLDGGLVCGYPLRCQLLTVPGQIELDSRRQQLLSRADVVVLVCESTNAGVEDAKRFLPRHEAHPPIIVQANKQDLDDSLSPEQVAHLLGLPDAHVVGAKASDSAGVRETAVVAIRMAADLAQKQIQTQGLPSLHGRVETGEDLLAEMLASEAKSAVPSRSRASLVTIDTGVDISAMDLIGPQSTPTQLRLDSEPDKTSPTFSVTDSDGATSVPETPNENEPSGFVWPADGGRMILRRIAAAGPPVLHRELIAQKGANDGSGTHDTIVLEAGMWCLKTSLRRRFQDADSARAALLRLARHKTLLGRLLLKNTSLALHQDKDGYWLWTLSPWVTTLRAQLDFAVQSRDEQLMGDALEQFAYAALDAMRLAAEQGIVLDIHPSNLGVIGANTYYLDDDIGSGTNIPALGYMLLQRVEEIAGFDQAIDRYVTAIEKILKASEPIRHSATDLAAALRTVITRHPASEQARVRLLSSPWVQRASGGS